MATSHRPEAKTLRAIKQAFPANEVPVPELFGWRSVGNKNFIYMSLVPGKTLQEIWASLTTADKASIRDQLGRIVAALQRATQGSPDRFIGMLASLVQDFIKVSILIIISRIYQRRTGSRQIFQT